MRSVPPVRTCVLCRRRGEKESLLRFVRVSESGEGGAGIAVDAGEALPGRGVYCHASIECLGQRGAARVLKQALLRGSSRSHGSGQRMPEAGEILDILAVIDAAFERRGVGRMTEVRQEMIERLRSLRSGIVCCREDGRGKARSARIRL